MQVLSDLLRGQTVALPHLPGSYGWLLAKGVHISKGAANCL